MYLYILICIVYRSSQKNIRFLTVNLVLVYFIRNLVHVSFNNANITMNIKFQTKAKTQFTKISSNCNCIYKYSTSFKKNVTINSNFMRQTNNI